MAKADLIVHIVALHEKTARKAAKKKAKQEAKAAAAAEAARLKAEKEAEFAAKRKAQEQAERARQEREAAEEAARLAAEEAARKLAEEQARERARLAAEAEAKRRAGLTGPRATLAGLLAATGAPRPELLQVTKRLSFTHFSYEQRLSFAMTGSGQPSCTGFERLSTGFLCFVVT